MTILNNSFCIIENDEQASYFDNLKLYKPKYNYPWVLRSNKKKHWFVPDDDGLNSRNFIDYVRKRKYKEISVYDYHDLIHDKIVRWRLKEIGFEEKRDNIWGKKYYQLGKITVGSSYDVYFMDEPMIGIRTFTNLLTLIKLIG